MENDLVKEVKNKCSELGHRLYSKYDEYRDRGICDLAEVNGKDKDSVGIEYLNEIVTLIENEQKIYNNVNKRNASTKNEQFKNLEKLVNNKLEEIEDFMKKKENVFEDALVVDAEKSENTEEENAEEEEVEVVSTHKPRKWPYFVLGAAAVAAVWLSTCCLKGCSKDPSRSNPTAISTEVNSTTMEPTTEAPTTVEPTTYVPTTEAVIPGSYGTFTDINDNQQIEDRAQYILDTYYAPFMDQLPEEERKVLTADQIANTIRTMNGELPLDNNGYKTKDGVTVDTYGNKLIDYIQNIPSSDALDYYYHVPAHMFAVDGSELSEFIKTYDVLYEKMVYGLNTRNDEEVQDAIACLGYKFWYEWFLQGRKGFANPHHLSPELKYFAYQATTRPYGSTALESDINMKRPVCIEACFPYEGAEVKEALTVTSIWTALDTGEWNQISARLAGMDEDKTPLLPLFWESLDDQLNFKYEHSNTLKLN